MNATRALGRRASAAAPHEHSAAGASPLISESSPSVVVLGQQRRARGGNASAPSSGLLAAAAADDDDDALFPAVAAPETESEAHLVHALRSIRHRVGAAEDQLALLRSRKHASELEARRALEALRDTNGEVDALERRLADARTASEALRCEAAALGPEVARLTDEALALRATVGREEASLRRREREVKARLDRLTTTVTSQRRRLRDAFGDADTEAAERRLEAAREASEVKGVLVQLAKKALAARGTWGGGDEDGRDATMVSATDDGPRVDVHGAAFLAFVNMTIEDEKRQLRQLEELMEYDDRG